jgi:hypothetical protein
MPYAPKGARRLKKTDINENTFYYDDDIQIMDVLLLIKTCV